MAVEVAGLSIVVDTKGVDSANKGLLGLAKHGKNAEKSTDGLASSFKRLLAPVAAVVSVGAGFQKFTAVSRQFDVLSAGLETATGSADSAAIAFEALERFASETPYLLDQSVEGFTKLVNLGLTPSERALKSYGDTSAALGKDLMQMIEAVADAATGEFERLKEFGIKAKNQGDTIAFTFRGITTEVANNAADIEEYLIKLGENDFAGAMAKRMDTLDGALSNLEDEWDRVFRSLSQSGAGDIMEAQVRQAISALQELNDIINSGQLNAGLDVIASKFLIFEEDAVNALNAVSILITAFEENTGIQFDILGKEMISAFENMPENIRAFIQIMTVELAAFIDKSAAYGKEIMENLTFWKDEEFDLEQALENIDQARLSSIDTILTERDVLIESYEAEKAKIVDLGEVYKKIQRQKKESATGDVLSQFGVGPQSGKSPEVVVQEELAKAAKAANDELEDQESIAKDVGVAMGDAFEDAIFGAESFSDVLKNLDRQLGMLIIRSQAIAPFERAIGEFDWSSLFASSSSSSPNVDSYTATHDWSLASFDGGGWTGDGARTGGLDGKGGFLAMMHPQEDVIDHSKGGAGGAINLTQNINISATDGRDIDERIVRGGQEAAAAAYQMIAHDAATNGPISRAIRGR